MSEIIKSYKGFNKDMTCRGFKFEEGKEYEEEIAEACKCGFHACEYPLDVFKYYEPSKSVFHEVEQSGEISRADDDSKIASTKIKTGASISIAGLVRASIEYIKSKCEKENNSDKRMEVLESTGYGSANSATGDWSANSATGDGSANSATGYGSANVSTGIDCSNNAAGERNISVGWGRNNICKGCIGSFLVLSEWGEWDGKKYPFITAKMVQVDGEKIKADTWYKIKNGEIIEVESEE